MGKARIFTRPLLSLGIIVLNAAALFAQEASPTATPSVNENGTAEAERVMVTGSNIPTAAEVGPNPLQTLDRDTIEKSGERTTTELLKSLPVANANSVPASNNSGDPAQGAASISLRGLDPGATLVLIDGHRIVSFPSGAQGGAQAFFDINSIPRAAIESIEILKDGASSIYGADAVAGVVNIKLRHNYDGAEANVEYGNTTDRDSGEFSSSLLFGIGEGDTNITGVVNYHRRNSISDADRSYSARPFSLSTSASPFNLELSRDAVIAAGGNPDPALGDTFFGHAPFLSNGNSPAADYVYTAGRAVTFNPQKYIIQLPDRENYGFYLNADHKVFDEQLVLFADFSLQRGKIHYDFSPTNTGDFENSINGHILAIPPHAPGPTLSGPTYEETGVTPGAYNPFNPFQQIISGGTRGRLFDFGPRLYDTTADSLYPTLGVRGDKLFDGNWGYDLAARYSYIVSNDSFKAQSAPLVNRIFNAADPIFNQASSEYIGTTMPYNPFGDYRRPISNNSRLVDFATVYAKTENDASLLSIDLNVYTTNLLTLPAGGVGLAFGGQFQNEDLANRASAPFLHGDVIQGTFYTQVFGSRVDYATYAEVRIPIFSPSFTATGFHALELTAATRYEAFADTKSNVMVPKFGLRWQPFDDSLTLRATWGEGYKQPALNELNATPFTFFQDVFDPVSGKTYPEFGSKFVPNRNLQAEDARTFSGGIVYTPKFLTGLTVTIDLFDIETTGWINPFIDPSDVLKRVAEGHGLPGEIVKRDANGDLVSLQLTDQNSGSQKVRGADFTVSYLLPTSFGTFTSVSQATFLDSYQFASVPGETEQELRSSAVGGSLSQDAYLKWKGRSRVDWSRRGLTVGITSNYRDGFHEINELGREHWVKQTWFFDLQASYNFDFIARETSSVAGVAVPAHEDGKNPTMTSANVARPAWKRWLAGTTLTIGCNDIFDHDPPTSVSNYPRFIYDPTGRFVYFSVTKKLW